MKIETYSTSGCFVLDLDRCDYCNGTCDTIYIGDMTLCPSYVCNPVDNPLQPLVDGLQGTLSKYVWGIGLLGTFVVSQCLYFGYRMVFTILVRRSEAAAAAAAAATAAAASEEEGDGPIIRSRRRWWQRQKEAEQRAERKIISLQDSSTEEEEEGEEEEVAGAGALWSPMDEASVEKCLRKSAPPKTTPYFTSVG